jgi:flavorubredoxin
MYVGKTLRYENIFKEIRVLMDKEKIDYMTPIEIAEDIYWIGYADEGASLHCNPYIIIDGNEAVVIDGGSREEFSTVMLKILRLGVIPQNINALVYQHADPDLCASVPQFEAIIDKEDLAIISSRSEHIFLKYYLSYESSRSRILNIDEMGYEFSFSSGRKLKFIPIPYVHTPGSFMTYDTKTKTLFTSDLFGSFDTDWELFTRLPVLMSSYILHHHTIIFRAISSLIAMREFLTFIMALPSSLLTMFILPPGTTPRFSRCLFTSGLPPTLFMVFSLPTTAKLRGINPSHPLSLYWISSLVT